MTRQEMVFREAYDVPTSVENDDCEMAIQGDDVAKENNVCSTEEDAGLCVICLETIDSSERISGTCKHVFHKDCLKEWMTNNHDDCPTCRQPLVDLESCLGIVRSPSRRSVVVALGDVATTSAQAPSSDPTDGRLRIEGPDETSGNRFCSFCCAIVLNSVLTYFLVWK